jgi:TRAP-type mannitol/chloroaromatic compound transport system substrate-binding protein
MRGGLNQMKKKLALPITICMALVMTVSLLLAACAPTEEPASTQPIQPGYTPGTTPGKPATTTAPTKPVAAPEAEVFNWKFQTIGTNVSPWYTSHKNYLEPIISEMTDGRLLIEVLTVNTIVPPAEALDACMNGLLEMHDLTGGYYAGKDPEFSFLGEVKGAPLNNLDELLIFMYNTGFEETVTNKCAEYNQKFLAPSLVPGEQLLVNKPIRTLEDFKGTVMRFGAGGPDGQLLEMLGGKPVSISAAEVYTAISLGTIDGGNMSGPNGNWAAGLHEVAKYAISPIFYTTFALLHQVVNIDAWNTLPPDLQQSLQVACVADGYNFYKQNIVDDIAALDKQKEYGVEFITLPPEDVAQLESMIKQVWEEWAEKNTVNAAVIDQMKQALKMLGKEGWY